MTHITLGRREAINTLLEWDEQEGILDKVTCETMSNFELQQELNARQTPEMQERYMVQSNTKEASKYFELCLRQFQEAGSRLAEAWLDLDDPEVLNYPEYMPSFDEFVAEFKQVEQKPESEVK